MLRYDPEADRHHRMGIMIRNAIKIRAKIRIFLFKTETDYEKIGQGNKGF